jgi:hypothetical protein
MKTAAHLVFFSILASSACFAQADRAWVRVKMENDMGSKIDTITFVISDGYISQTKYTVADKDGIFLAGFDISNSIDILWGFGKNATLPLIISPNDTIHVTIVSEKNGILFGKRARTCDNLMGMYEAKKRPQVQAYESEYTADAGDFITFMNERLNAHLRFANNFCKSNKCTKTFVTWYIKSAYVSFYRNLSDYGHYLRRNASDVTQRNNFIRSRDVIMKAIDLNDPTLEMSSGYYDLLKSVLGLYVTPQELRSMYYTKASAILLQKNLSEGDDRAVRRIQSGSIGQSDVDTFTRLAHRYRKDVNSEMRNVLDPAIRQKFDEIKDQDLKKVIIAYYKGLWDWI